MANLYKVTKETVKCEIARIAYLLSKPFFKQKVWLFCETEDQAQENGYTLYRWVKDNKPEIRSYYVLGENSPVYDKLVEDKCILRSSSIAQYFYLFHSSIIASTHGLWCLPDGLGIQKKINRKVLRAQKVMLNHGLCFLKNGKNFYHKDVFALNDHMTALSEKHKAIFTDLYGYDSSEVSITGYPRLDKMLDSSQEHDNYVLIMPTFRDGEQRLGSKFVQTDLYKNIEAFLLDQSVKKSLIEHDLKILIYLHQDNQDSTDCFRPLENDRVRVVKQGEFSVTELLSMSKLLITDYSSVLFDFIYMEKPFISYQFDRERFLASREHKPIIDIGKDLPGKTVDTHTQLVDTYMQYVCSNFTMEQEYKDKISDYFLYRDTNNCQRVFELLSKLQ